MDAAPATHGAPLVSSSRTEMKKYFEKGVSLSCEIENNNSLILINEHLLKKKDYIRLVFPSSISNDHLKYQNSDY